MMHYILQLVLLLSTVDFTSSQTTEEPPFIPPILDVCFHGQSAAPEIKYFNTTLEIDGLCDESAIDRCDLENAIRVYFNAALDCTPANEQFVSTGGPDYLRLLGYSEVILYDITVTQNSLSNCKIEVLITTETLLEAGSGGGGECGIGCVGNNPGPSTSFDYFPFGTGGSFRRIRQRRQLSGKSTRDAKSSKSTKLPKSSKSKTTGSPTSAPQRAPEVNACGEPLFVSSLAEDGFNINGVEYKELVEVSKCETKFACIRDPCTKPGGDICNDIA